MTHSIKIAALTAVAIGAAATAWTTSDSVAHKTTGEEHCEIAATESGGSLVLHGIASGETGEQGSYRLRVSGGSNGGRSQISQGGAFTIGSNGEATLGTVMLNAHGIYDVDLDVRIGNHTETCNETVGGRI